MFSYLNYYCVTEGLVPTWYVLGWILKDFTEFFQGLYLLIVAKAE